MRVRSSRRKFSQPASVASPASVIFVRASSASTIRTDTGASFSSTASSQRPGELAVRTTRPSVGTCERGTSRIPSDFSSAAISAARGRQSGASGITGILARVIAGASGKSAMPLVAEAPPAIHNSMFLISAAVSNGLPSLGITSSWSFGSVMRRKSSLALRSPSLSTAPVSEPRRICSSVSRRSLAFCLSAP